MAITEFAKQYHEWMFPGYVSKFLETDPEFIERFDNCAVLGQLERLDWTGKNVFALMTHEGSGLGHCERDLQKICKGAKIGKGLAVSGGSASGSEKTVAAWAKKCVG